MADSQTYELWETNTFLGVYRDVEADPLYWMQWFGNEAETDANGWIDFEKMPIRNRKLAPFVMPLARGKSIYDDTSTHMRFKPAYIKLEDEIDPLMPLTRRVGIDANASQPLASLSPMERIEAIRMAITVQHLDAINRTKNYMACVALRDGQIVIEGEDYPAVTVNFQRDAGHTETLGAGSRWGESGVSIVDHVQSVIDIMTMAEFGGMPTRITMGGLAWAAMRQDDEFKEHMDTNFRDPRITYERALVTGAGEKVFKVGEMMVGGASGAIIELWVDNSTFRHPMTGAETRFIGANQALFTGTAQAVNGYRAYGAIIDRAAEYQSMPIFPKNWLSQGDVEVEYITHKSAPLFVPINPNATFLSNVVAAP
ncbi:MAG: major capsid protein [Pseudomonadota bacterium]